jgi:two-component system sensor histidine kinase MtrB
MAADMLHGAREDFPPEIARSAELLQKELDRFEGLLVDLLEISRYDAGAAVLDPELVDLRVAVQRVVDAVAPLAERHGSEVVVRSFGTLGAARRGRSPAAAAHPAQPGRQRGGAR